MPRRRWQETTRSGLALLAASAGGTLSSSPQPRDSKPSPRIFLGLTEVCGYYTNLRHGFSELGLRSVFVALEAHPFQYGDQPSNRIIQWAQRSTRGRLTARTKPARLWWSAVDIAARVLLFSWAIASFDVFVFSFGSSFFRNLELPLLRWSGKKIVCVFHGSDERPPYLSGYVMRDTARPGIDAAIAMTRAMKQRIRRIERYADVVVSHPLSAHLHERPIVPFLSLGIGYQMASVPPGAPPPSNGTVRILHAPSRPEAKGTSRIRAAVASLRTKGHSIELVEVVNRPNADVLQEMARCDLIVDEVWSDTPMAGFAAEAACFGKPAVVGGYGWDLLREMVPADRFPPSHTCHPEALEAAIELLVVDGEYRRELGERARHFVESRWTIRKVAEAYLELIEGDDLERWLRDPKGTLYLQGCGMEEQRVRETVRAFIERGGRAALHIGDRPDWEDAFVRFAGLEDG